jgi:hypothetical protein
MTSHDHGKPNAEKQDAQLTEAEKKANVKGSAPQESLEAAVQPEVTIDPTGGPAPQGTW